MKKTLVTIGATIYIMFIILGILDIIELHGYWELITAGTLILIIIASLTITPMKNKIDWFKVFVVLALVYLIYDSYKLHGHMNNMTEMIHRWLKNPG